ncbi:MAG: hypothetical protein WC415_06270, partial [Patescibacteria group bacterium]
MLKIKKTLLSEPRTILLSLLGLSLFVSAVILYPHINNLWQTKDVEAAGEINVYYSVGQNTSDHKTGTPTIIITGNTAVFSVPQTATNMGVGDQISYGNASATTTAYISSKVSSTTWNVITRIGSQPTATTTATVLKIAHAFSSLSAAINGSTSGAANTSHLNSTNLTAATGTNAILNIPCYYDSGADILAVTVINWTTSVNNYIRIYTPTNTVNEVNQSQRHSGVWNSTKYNLSVTNNTTLSIRSGHVRVDGLQIKLVNNSGTSARSAVYIYPLGIPAVGVYLSNNIIAGDITGGTVAPYGIWAEYENTSGGIRSYRINNNIIYGFLYNSSGYSTYFRTSGTFYFYNNTVINNGGGLNRISPAVVVAKNNISYGNTDNYIDSFAASSTNNLSGPAADAQIPATNARNGVAVTFVSTSTNNFHLDSSDAGAKNNGVPTDAGFVFSNDIDGQSRPSGSAWDIGADEVMEADATPPVLSNGSPSGTLARTTTGTTISVTTDESATCKYATTTGVAYASMANTFSTTGGASHGTTVSGLSSGNTFHYYVRCQDLSGNPNTSDYDITFRVTNGTAASCSQDDVQTEINLAVNGDTVTMPPGTCTWGNPLGASYGYHSVTVNKPINLLGSGQGITTIVDDTELISGVNPLSVVYSSDINTTIRLGNFTLTHSANPQDSSAAIGLGTSGNGWNKVIIEHLTVDSIQLAISANLSQPGIISSSTFINSKAIYIDGDYLGSDWDSPLEMGSEDAWFIENSDYIFSTFTDGASDGRNGAKIVFRHNTLTLPSGSTFSGYPVGSHGYDTADRSNMSAEVYDNVFNNNEPGIYPGAVQFRGGTGVVFNNTFNGLHWKTIYVTNYRSCTGYIASAKGMCDGTISEDGNTPPLESNYGWPCRDQIGRSGGTVGGFQTSDPLYQWNNINAGSVTDISVYNGSTGDCSYTTLYHIKPDRDYFDRTPRPNYVPYPYPHPSTLSDYAGTRALDLSTSTNASQITLSWDTVTDATEYAIFRDWVHISTTTDTSYIESLPASGTVYMVYSYDASGDVLSSEGVLFLTDDLSVT